MTKQELINQVLTLEAEAKAKWVKYQKNHEGEIITGQFPHYEEIETYEKILKLIRKLD